MNTVEPQNVVATVASKIATEAAPDEIDLAPIMAQAYIQGGQSREELFKQRQGSLAGGFGPGGIIALFPWILKAIANNVPLIYKILTTNVADLLDLVNNLLDLPGKLKRQETLKALPESPYQPLKTVINTISQELEASGLSQDQVDLTTFRIVKALLENPQESKIFIETIGQQKP